MLHFATRPLIGEKHTTTYTIIGGLWVQQAEIPLFPDSFYPTRHQTEAVARPHLSHGIVDYSVGNDKKRQKSEF